MGEREEGCIFVVLCLGENDFAGGVDGRDGLGTIAVLDNLECGAVGTYMSDCKQIMNVSDRNGKSWYVRKCTDAWKETNKSTNLP